jgi:transcriptional regulator with XRE-family HTH domain
MKTKAVRRPDSREDKIGRKISPAIFLGDPRQSALPVSPVIESKAALQKSDGRPSIGEVIRTLRKEKGISQNDLARRAHVDRTTIARVECGIFKSLSMEKLGGIAEAIGVDLQNLLLRAESQAEPLSHRGELSHIEFTLEYPEQGFRIGSFTPKRKEFFFGKLELEPEKVVASEMLPHPEQIYLHSLEGKMLLTCERKEFLLKPGDCFAFAGRHHYEFYNPDPLRRIVSLYITYPSFLPI